MEGGSVILLEIASKKGVYCLEKPPSKRFVSALVLSLADIVDSETSLALSTEYYVLFSRIAELHNKLKLHLCGDGPSFFENLKELVIFIGCPFYKSIAHGVYVYSKCPPSSRKSLKIRKIGAMRLDDDIYLVKLGNIFERLEITSELRLKKYVPEDLLQKALEILKNYVETKGPLKTHLAEHLVATEIGLSRLEARQILSKIEKLRYLGIISGYITSVRFSRDKK